jgi:outer membrane protein TolC
MIRHSSDGTTNRSGQLAILRYSVRTAYLELLELRERVSIAEANARSNTRRKRKKLRDKEPE